jgi:hypothetical protein
MTLSVFAEIDQEESALPCAQIAVRWLTALLSLAMVLVVLGSYLLTSLLGTEPKGRQEPRPSIVTSNSAADPQSKRSDVARLVSVLKACGNGPDEETVKRALTFVSRCQNQEIGHNAPP